MKNKLAAGLLILVVSLMAGCATSQRDASLNPDFPPAPPTSDNTPSVDAAHNSD